MKYYIEVLIDGDSPPEPTGILDFITLGWIVFCILIMIICAILTKRQQISFYPLRTVTNEELIIICVCGTIDMSAIFIANEQLSWLKDIRHWSCVLWSYWLQYPFGVAPMFVIIVRRMLYRTYNFHRKFSMISMIRKRLIHNWIIFIILSSIIILCSWITVTDATYIDNNSQTCTTEVVEKILLCLWVFICATMSMLMCLILQRGIGKNFISEWRPVKKMVIFMCIVFTLDLLINTLGLLRYSVGRSIFTFSRASLYLFCTIMLVGRNLLLSFKKDQDEYVQETLNSYLTYNISIWNVHELAKSRKLMDEFLNYCTSLRTERIVKTITSSSGAQRVLDPARMAECYRKIQQLKTDVGILGHDILITIGKSIINIIMPELDIPDEVKLHIRTYEYELPDVSVFASLEKQLLDDFQLGWGDEYLSQRNAKLLEERYQEENSIPLSNESFISRRGKERLNKLTKLTKTTSLLENIDLLDKKKNESAMMTEFYELQDIYNPE